MPNEMLSHQELTKRLAEKEGDIEELAEFIFAVFRAMGVKDFSDIDNIGKTVMKSVPQIMMEATMQKHRLAKRFECFTSARPLMEKYKHLIPEA